MPAHAVITTVINQPSEVVFDTIHNYDKRLEWDTLLRRAYVVGPHEPDTGVETVCVAKWHLGGFSFRTRYVSFRRPTLAAVVLVKPYFVFSKWAASIRHKELSPGTSEVVYTLTFNCRPHVLAGFLERCAGWMFEKETARRLSALKRYLEAQPTA